MIRRSIASVRAHGAANAALWIASSIACALAALIPMYTSVSAVAILEDLTDRAAADPTPPFSYFFATDPGLAPVSWTTLAAADDYLSTQAAGDLGLPGARGDARVVSRRFTLSEGAKPDGAPDHIAFASIDRFDSLTTIVEGERPTDNDLLIEAAVAEPLSHTVPVGTELVLVDDLLTASDPGRLLRVRIVAVWQPIDPSDQRWIVSPSVLSDQLIVSRQLITEQLGAERPPVIATAQWSIVGDAAAVRPDALLELPQRSSEVARQVDDRSDAVSLTRDPGRLLRDVARERADLAATMRAYAVPAALVTAIFLGMVMTLNVQRRKTELAVLRSRGLPRRFTIGAVVAETAMVAVAAGATGAVGALALTQLMLRTTAFLTFEGAATKASFWQPVPVGWIAATAIAIVLAQAVMLIRPSGQTIVDRQRSRGRLVDLGQSALSSLDLVVVAFIAAVLLQRRSLPIADTGLRDPWVIATPAAAGLAAGLVTVRLLPPLATFAARLAERTRSVSLFLGAQRMARSPGSYRWPVVLVVVATALTAFVASLSLTLERRLVEETMLTEGADHVLVDVTPGRPGATPLSAYTDLPGVAAATRTVEVEGRFGETKEVNRAIEIIAVEPTSFPDATHWQASYDDQTLAELMAPLRTVPGAVVVSESLADQYDLTVGDPIRYAVAVRFSADGTITWLDSGGVVGAVTDRFPRWTGPDRAPLLVIDARHLNASVDQLGRSTTLIRMQEPGQPLAIDAGGLASSASERIADARRSPDRQAVFAILTTTFGIAMIVALLSLALQSLTDFRERSIDVGVMRALGIDRRAVRSQLSFDFLTIAILGTATGTAVGISVAWWLIPDLVDASNRTAELAARPTVAWLTIAATAACFLVVVIAIVATAAPLLARRKLFEALQLGETP